MVWYNIYYSCYVLYTSSSGIISAGAAMWSTMHPELDPLGIDHRKRMI
jgi:hypothetical protein